jgi:hypothetical protein
MKRSEMEPMEARDGTAETKRKRSVNAVRRMRRRDTQKSDQLFADE